MRLARINLPVSAAPGFRVDSVFVMAGVPRIMQAMLDHVLQIITPGEAMLTRTVMVDAPESEIAGVLGAVQDRFTDVDIGSYPQFKQGGGWGVSVVLRGRDESVLEEAQGVLTKELSSKGMHIKLV